MGTTWIVEKGNTLWKIGIFDEGNLISRLSFEEFTAEAIPPGTPSEIMLTGSGSWKDQRRHLYLTYAQETLSFLSTGMIIL